MHYKLLAEASFICDKAPMFNVVQRLENKDGTM
jgi:hypothetical protein